MAKKQAGRRAAAKVEKIIIERKVKRLKIKKSKLRLSESEDFQNKCLSEESPTEGPENMKIVSTH